MVVELGISVVDAGSTGVFQAIKTQQDLINESARKGAERYKYLNLSVRKLYSQTRTPAEQHNQRLKELDRLLKSGKIDQDLYNRSVERSAQSMRRMDRASDAAGKSAGAAFGSKLVRNIDKVAGAIGIGTVAGGLVGAITLFKSAANEANQEIKSIADNLRQGEESLKRIWQISGSKGEYTNLSTQMKLATALEGLSQEEAGALTFSMKSAGLEKEIGALLPTKRFMDPRLAADFETMMRASYGQKYTPQQAISGLLTGAEKSAFNVEQTAKLMKEIGPEAKPLGASPGEIAGITAALSYQYSTPEKATTGFRSLVKELKRWKAEATASGRYKPEQLGGTILETFDAMRRLDPEYYQKRKLSEVEFAGFVERLEKKQAEAVKLTTATQKAFTGTGEAYRRKANVPMELDRIQQRRVAELQKELAHEPAAQAKLELETLVEQGKTLAGVYGTPLSLEELDEKFVATGEKLGFINAMRERNAERVLTKLAQRDPLIFKKHLGGLVKTRRHTPSYGAEGAGGLPLPAETIVDLPGPLTGKQRRGFAAAVGEVLSRKIQQRAGLDQPGGQLPRVGTDGGDLQHPGFYRPGLSQHEAQSVMTDAMHELTNALNTNTQVTREDADATKNAVRGLAPNPAVNHRDRR